jgi:acetyl/propionyl-CoA carboxylase alpha subunit
VGAGLAISRRSKCFALDARSWGSSGDRPEIKVSSDINTRVFKIEVAVGEAVCAGDTRMILESMKMQIPIEGTSLGLALRNWAPYFHVAAARRHHLGKRETPP